MIHSKTLLYTEIPQYYTRDNKQKKWNRRKRGTTVEGYPGVFMSPCIGRVYTINPKQSECYFLRILLHEIKGPTSFNNIRVVEDTQFTTYSETCRALGLIEDDNYLQNAIEEASQSECPSQLRNLFAVILTSCEPSNPLGLWETHHRCLAEDLIHNAESNPDLGISEEDAVNECLHLIQQLVINMGGNEL